MSVKTRIVCALLGVFALLGIAVGYMLWGRHTAQQQYQDTLRRYKASQGRKFSQQFSAVKGGRATCISLYATLDTDAKMQQLVGLENLEELLLEECDLSGEGMKYIAEIPNLKTFYYMYYWRIGDKGMVHLANSKSLETLVVVESGVTADGLRALEQAANLRSLVYCESNADTAQPKFGKEVIAALSGFRKLEFLGIGGAWLTEADIRELRRILPNTNIEKVTGEMSVPEMLGKGARGRGGDA